MKTNLTNFTKFAKERRVQQSQINKTFGYTTSPMVIEERQLNASTISVFDRLMMDRIIFLGEEIDDFVANIINAQLLYLDNESESTEPISIYINSPGGSCYSGLAIYDTMQMIKSPVHTYIMGLAASMAFVLACSGEKKHRYSLKHSRGMMHQPLSGISFSQATDIDIFNKEVQSIKQDMAEIISKQTKNDLQKVLTDMDRDCWMKADEMIKYGVIDKIINK